MVSSLLNGMPLGVASAAGLITLIIATMTWQPPVTEVPCGNFEIQGEACETLGVGVPRERRAVLQRQTLAQAAGSLTGAPRTDPGRGPPTCGLGYTPIELWSCHQHSSKGSGVTPTRAHGPQAWRWTPRRPVAWLWLLLATSPACSVTRQGTHPADPDRSLAAGSQTAPLNGGLDQVVFRGRFLLYSSPLKGDVPHPDNSPEQLCFL